ncbi:TolC family protein [Flavobacterium plurextorum]|uniref:TolC family protein n=1 Tax=Flavobacterium quisquiliarum TaxID=1834436 RepID=A0ABV8VYD5_9FLAO|nr:MULTISPECIES: TolC family protein [Flavobacterium]MBW1656024.1 TolC family protein [Flavobacterium quisquiliarum]UUW07230.1 TolC family protein [Flavobacterium plurextorum]
MNYKIIFISIFFCSQILYPQRTHKVNDFINNMYSSTEMSNINKNQSIKIKENSLFNKSFLPDISLSFTLPAYNRSISEILQPDGTYAFRESNNANSRVNLTVSQKLPFTGGQLSISNSFNRLDNFDQGDVTTSYSASWLGASLSQPLNFFNEMKWDKRIQDARYQANEIEYKRVQIEVKKKAVEEYFQILQIKNEKIINNKALQTADIYKKVLKKLINAGRLIAYDSIDIELKVLDLQKRSRFLSKSESLKTESINHFFNSRIIDDNDYFETPKLQLDLKDKQYYIDRYLELFAVMENSRLLGLEKSVKRLESSRFYSANVTIGAGFNNASNYYYDIFQNPNQSQNFSISLSVPLLDFGRKRTELEISRTQYDIETSNLKQEKLLTLDRINFLYEEVKDLAESLAIEEDRLKLLTIKLKRMETLLFAHNILLKEYSETENEYFNTVSERIDILKNCYEKITEIELITLIDILKNEN